VLRGPDPAAQGARTVAARGEHRPRASRSATCGSNCRPKSTRRTPSWTSTAAAADHAFLEVEGTAEEAAKLLEWFADRHDLDLAYKYDLEPGWIPKHLMKPGPIPEEGWCVHQERGGRNDREWTMIALEATPLAALREAHKAFCDGQ
jgi:hypothetical protein